MSFTVHHLPLKMRAKIAATLANGIAVALAELPAAIMSFQRQRASLSLHKKCQFSGFSRPSRQTSQRNLCKLCKKCNNNCIISIVLNIGQQQKPFIYS